MLLYFVEAFEDKVYNSFYSLYGAIGFNFQFTDCRFQFRLCFIVKFIHFSNL